MCVKTWKASETKFKQHKDTLHWLFINLLQERYYLHLLTNFSNPFSTINTKKIKEEKKKFWICKSMCVFFLFFNFKKVDKKKAKSRFGSKN
jgi:phosphate starvation-inducible membrane PsiE